jgi:hypothetical protein
MFPLKLRVAQRARRPQASGYMGTASGDIPEYWPRDEALDSRRPYPQEVSTWRRRALEIFPDLSRELTSADVNSTYSLWQEVLLPRVREAHTEDDRKLLARIYGYAAWSMRQPGKDVWNAAAVSFYEHLFDRPQSEDWIERVVEWISDDVVQDVWSLWVDGPHRLSGSDLIRLRKHLAPASRPGSRDIPEYSDSRRAYS